MYAPPVEGTTSLRPSALMPPWGVGLGTSVHGHVLAIHGPISDPPPASLVHRTDQGQRHDRGRGLGHVPWIYVLLRGAQAAPRCVVVGRRTTPVRLPPPPCDASTWITARDERDPRDTPRACPVDLCPAARRPGGASLRCRRSADNTGPPPSSALRRIHLDHRSRRTRSTGHAQGMSRGSMSCCAAPRRRLAALSSVGGQHRSASLLRLATHPPGSPLATNEIHGTRPGHVPWIYVLLRGAQAAPRCVVVGRRTTPVRLPPPPCDASTWITARDERDPRDTPRACPVDLCPAARRPGGASLRCRRSADNTGPPPSSALRRIHLDHRSRRTRSTGHAQGMSRGSMSCCAAPRRRLAALSSVGGQHRSASLLRLATHPPGSPLATNEIHGTRPGHVPWIYVLLRGAQAAPRCVVVGRRTTPV